MWTAEITSVTADSTSGIAQVAFHYAHTDGRSVEVTERISEPSSIKKIASDKVRELTRIDAVADFIANPTLGPIDLTPVAPTEEQLAAQDLAQKRMKLTQIKQDAELADFVAQNPTLSLDNPVSPLVNIASPAETVAPLIAK